MFLSADKDDSRSLPEPPVITFKVGWGCSDTWREVFDRPSVDPSLSGGQGTSGNSASSWTPRRSYLSRPCTQTSHRWWRRWWGTPLLSCSGSKWKDHSINCIMNVRFIRNNTNRKKCDCITCTFLLMINRWLALALIIHVKSWKTHKAEWWAHLSSLMRASRGSSHPTVHSQWASKKVMTWPLVAAAPLSLARMSPERCSILRILTGTSRVRT